MIIRIFTTIVLVLFAIIPSTANQTQSPQVKMINTDAMLPASVQALWENGYGACDNEGENINEMVNGLEISFHEGVEGSALYILPCGGAGTYNTPYWAYSYSAKTGIAREISFPIMREGNPSVKGEIYNKKWDNARLELSSFGKDRGLADCGNKYLWKWAYPQADSNFILLAQWSKRECDGERDNFPQVWPLKNK